MSKNVLDNTIEAINNAIVDRLSDIGVSYSLFGLCSPVITKSFDDEDGRTIPALVDITGEGDYPFIDDRVPFGAYHRLSSKNYATVKGYGGGNKDVEVCDLYMVCWGSSALLNMRAEEVERTILIPSIPAAAKLVQTNFDPASVFATEFKGVPFNVPSNLFLFSLRYRIQYVFERNCINT